MDCIKITVTLHTISLLRFLFLHGFPPEFFVVIVISSRARHATCFSYCTVIPKSETYCYLMMNVACIVIDRLYTALGLPFPCIFSCCVLNLIRITVSQHKTVCPKIIQGRGYRDINLFVNFRYRIAGNTHYT